MSPRHTSDDELIQRAVQEARDLGPMPDVTASFAQVRERLAAARSHTDDHLTPVIRRARGPNALGSYMRGRLTSSAGIGVALVLCIAIATYLGLRSSASVASSVETITARSGEQVTTTLRDGTRVIVAPGSTVRVESEFGRATRTVALEGEAHFTVMQTTGTPFVVRTHSITTRVLGTTFSVRHDTPTDPVYVAVQSGKVVSGGVRGEVAVTAGQMARVTDSVATLDTDPTYRTDWDRGHLVFDRAPVSELLAAVSRWYGYRMVTNDSAMAAKRVSVVLKAADASDMMAQLKAVLDAEIVVRGTTVMLTPRSAHGAGRPEREPNMRADQFREVGR